MNERRVWEIKQGLECLVGNEEMESFLSHIKSDRDDPDFWDAVSNASAEEIKKLYCTVGLAEDQKLKVYVSPEENYDIAAEVAFDLQDQIESIIKEADEGYLVALINLIGPSLAAAKAELEKIE